MVQSTDALLKDMIARHAVLEQLVLNLLTVISRDFTAPREFREAMLDDVRARFAEAAKGPAGNADAEFARLALQRIGDLAQRMSQWRDDDTVQ